MNDLYRAVYLRSREYWNTRYNDVHLPLAYEHARQLVSAHPDCDPDVVLPAILLHDNGWKSIPEDQQLLAFGVTIRDFSLLRKHEQEGARIAAEILAALDVDHRRRAAIVSIVDGHDSRLECLSLDDALVKDADKVWRFTSTGIDIDHRRFNTALAEHLEWMAGRVDSLLFTEHGRGMARDALNDVRRAYEERRFV